MRLPLLLAHVAFRSAWKGPEWIGVGMAILLLNGLWPAVPVLTAMALVALGATAVILKRFDNTPQGALIVALNLLVYCGLYAIFVGASLHQLSLRPDHRPGVLTLFDLVTSVWPMAIAIQRSLSALVGCQSAE
jgi:hypothetical protein